MELKLSNFGAQVLAGTLLIVPYGIETGVRVNQHFDAAPF